MSGRLNIDILRELVACHSTPGDEGQVRAVLERAWRAAGWSRRGHGDFAVQATRPGASRRGQPHLLIAAHMDSPGFAVDRLPSPTDRQARPAVGFTRLGGAAFPGRTAGITVMTAAGPVAMTLRKSALDESNWDFSGRIGAAAAAHIRHGDRACFAGELRQHGHELAAPFLDNRLGCWLVAELPRLSATWSRHWRITVAATACEELGGFGAAVLASRLRPAPDLVVVVDATYEAPEQNVRLGGGPVLTLSDASVLLSPARRDAVAGLFLKAGVPLQTEVYNYSGTDARAFPHQGLAAPVLPLLLPTRGNHTPREIAHLADAEAWMDGMAALAAARLSAFSPPPGRNA